MPVLSWPLCSPLSTATLPVLVPPVVLGCGVAVWLVPSVWARLPKLNRPGGFTTPELTAVLPVP